MKQGGWRLMSPETLARPYMPGEWQQELPDVPATIAVRGSETPRWLTTILENRHRASICENSTGVFHGASQYQCPVVMCWDSASS